MVYASLISDAVVVASREILFNVVIAFLLVALGVCLGFIVKGLVQALLKGVKFDELVSKLHIGDLFGKLSLSELFADILEIAIVLVFVVQAFDQLGWTTISTALSQVLYWIPNVLAALVIFLVVYAVGRWLESRMRGSDSDVLHRLAPVALGVIVFFGAILGLDQLGFDTSLLRQAVLIIVFGFSLAFALAVGIAAGLGLKDDVHKAFGGRIAKAGKKRKKRKSKK